MREETGPQGGGYAWFVVFALILANTVSFVDRQILTLLVGPIRATLHISDTQLSLLHGLAFALFYTLLGIPIGRLVDRRRRMTIIAIGAVVWSVMTGLCGLARSFTQLFIARIGVGIGEATLAPGTYSLLADYFPAAKLSRALSVYTTSSHVGIGIATMAGGALIALVPALELPHVGHLEPWQVVFLVIAAPGFLVAALVYSLREPPRSGVDPGAHTHLRAAFDYIAARRAAFGLFIGGYALSSLVWNGTAAWAPTFLMRRFGWTTAEVGFRWGLAIMIAGVSGVLLGGQIAAWLRTRGRTDANIRIGLIALCIALPAGVIGPLVPSPWLSLALLATFQFGCSIPWGGAAAALQEITPNQLRGQVSAIYLFAINVFGIGFGPTLVAALTDYVFGRDDALGLSLALMIGCVAPLSALLLRRACGPYRAAMARAGF